MLIFVKISVEEVYRTYFFVSSYLYLNFILSSLTGTAVGNNM